MTKRFLTTLYLSLSVCAISMAQTASLLPVSQKALYDKQSVWYTDFQHYPQELKTLPVAVFDSGTGGFTVLEKILALDRFNNQTGEETPDGIPDFQQENFQYLGDQANMPYGRYSQEGKESYLRELAVKDALFLLNGKYWQTAGETQPTGVKSQVKILVIACNTATAYGLEQIQTVLKTAGSPVKVIGVVNAGSAYTLQQLGNQPVASIGVLATPGTISSGVYERTLRALAPATMTSLEIVNQPGNSFAEAVDEEKEFVDRSLTTFSDTYRGPQFGEGDADIYPELLDAYQFNFQNGAAFIEYNEKQEPVRIQLNSSDNYARYNLVALLEKARKQNLQHPMDYIILGCTHYPFCEQTLRDELQFLRTYTDKQGNQPYAKLIADNCQFIDPAVNTAYECYKSLKADGLLNPQTADGKLQPFISVADPNLPKDCLDADGNLTYAFKYGREPGTEDITTKVVPITDESMSADNLARIQRLLPLCYDKIQESKK